MVTDKQVRRLFTLSKVARNQEVAAAKAGLDPKTARKWVRLGKLPSEVERAPLIRFLFIDAHVCSTLPSDPISR